MNLTNTTDQTIDLPTLGLVVEPGASVDVPDSATDLLTTGWFSENTAESPADSAPPAPQDSPADPPTAS